MWHNYPTLPGLHPKEGAYKFPTIVQNMDRRTEIIACGQAMPRDLYGGTG